MIIKDIKKDNEKLLKIVNDKNDQIELNEKEISDKHNQIQQLKS